MTRPRIATLRPRVRTLQTGTTSLSAWTEDRRIRGTTLQNIRKAHFARFPLCVRCLALDPPRTTLAVELDHVIPLHQGGVDSRDPFENRAGLCADCHLAKSKAELGHAYKPRTPGAA